MNEILKWVQENYQWLVGTLLSSVITYHVYILSVKVSNKDKLEHKDKIKSKTDLILDDIIKNQLRRKAILININKYFKDYPNNSTKNGGYTYISGEIKTTRFDGVEFFASLPKEVYKKENGEYTFDPGKGVEQDFVLVPVGIVPYDWIDHIDPDGDEYDGYPIFYVHFNGRVYWSWWRRLIPFGYPYKRIVYYKIRDSYDEKNDHPDMKYTEFREDIS